MSQETSRIEAFSDGVIAIAATLLILEIRVPLPDDVHTPAELWAALVRLWPSYFAFVYSFGTIFVAWINHHHAIRFIAQPSRAFQYANGFLLMTITFLPFPTALLARYLTTDLAQPAIFFFCASSVLHNLGWLVLMETCLRVPGTVRPAARQEAEDLRRATMLGGAVYVATTILAGWYPVAALGINSSIWLLWIGMSLTTGRRGEG